MDDTWIKQEPGWYFSDEFGGICKEKDGWYAYHLDSDVDHGDGPYKTLLDAKKSLLKISPEKESRPNLMIMTLDKERVSFTHI